MKTSLLIFVTLYCVLLEIQAEVYRAKLSRNVAFRRKFIRNEIQKNLKRLYKPVKRTGTIPVDSIDDDLYTISITLGTPPQKFTVIPDTGSSDLWVVTADYDSKEGYQYKKNTFDPKKSSTFHDVGRNFTLYYSDSYSKGMLGADVFHLTSDFSYPFQVFGLATQIAMKLFWLPVDGVMGLGWPALSAFHARPPVSNILPQLTEPLFTIYLASHLDESNAHDGGLITLGALDTENCMKDITWLTLTSKTYWQVTVRRVSLGSFATTGWQQGTSDSGVAYLGIPISFVYPIMQELNTTWNFDFNEYEVDCKLQIGGPALIFDLQNNIFQVPSNQYIRKFKLESKEICLLSILEQYSVAFVPSWALGYPFLRSYCSVYDFGNARVGFALPLNM